jgi:hypothetical protein
MRQRRRRRKEGAGKERGRAEAGRGREDGHKKGRERRKGNAVTLRHTHSQFVSAGRFF